MSMFRWLFRCVRNFVGAVVVLAGLLALSEVGLRLQRFSAVEAEQTISDKLAPAWRKPSLTTGWEVPRFGTFPFEHGSETAVWKSNSWGLRGAEPVVPKPAGTYRILCLGDDAILGPRMEDAAILGQQLQRLLQSRSQSAIEVLTAAVPDGCPLSLSLEFRLHLTALQPDLILMHADADDLAADRQARKWLMHDAQGMPLACMHASFTPGTSVSWLSQARSEFALVDWAFRKTQHLSRPDAEAGISTDSHASNEPALATVLQPTTHLASLSRTHGGQLVVWLSPRTLHSQTVDAHRQFAAAAIPWLTQQRIPAVDGITALRPELLDPAGGWTSVGHQRLAEWLGEQLVQNLPGPWSSGYAAPSMLPAGYSTSEELSTVPPIRRAPRN